MIIQTIKAMKKLYIFFTILLTLTACSSENNAIDNEGPEVEPVVEVKGIQVELTDPVGLGDENITRSTIVYDDTKDIMAFKWGDTDCIGVFTYTDPEHSQQKRFSQINAPENTDHLRAFQTDEQKLKVNTDYKYVSCFPYFESHPTNYTNIPVSYLGQRQTKPVDFSNYWNNKNDEGYKESQKEASAHLPAYDFQCTGVTKPTPTGGIHFKMNRMGAIVRFWIKLKQEYNFVYDELQLVNSTKQFTTMGTMNAANAATTALTPTGQSHVVNLQLGEKLGEKNKGFDMTEQALGTNGLPTTPFYDYYNDKYTGYLMLYMMLAPIDLTGDDVENCFIYLVAHEKDHPENKHYFKSGPLSKPNLKPNTFYKWSPTPGEDTPIEMESIKVEVWREGTTFSNGDNGSGTEKW